MATPEYSDVPWSDPDIPNASINGTSVIEPWYGHVPPSENGVHFSAAHTPLHDPLADTRLAHLVRRRDHLLTRVHDLESRLVQQERQLAHLQSGHHHSEELRQLDVLRRSLEELDEQLLRAEQSQRRREEIAQLERQIDELRRQLAPSDILREASSLLQRLTEGAYRGIRLNDRREIWIEDGQGHQRDYRELSRGTQDQVYLSLALAIVDAYRQRGVELPVVLNDVFINIDTERAQLTAQLLADFANRGHQVILFTRHEHVIQRFASLPAKLYTLRQRPRVEEVPRASNGTGWEASPRWNPLPIILTKCRHYRCEIPGKHRHPTAFRSRRVASLPMTGWLIGTHLAAL